MAKVPRKVTTFSEGELANALILGYEDVFGSLPTHKTIVNAWSQCALECGRDGKGNISKCRCFNLGNITITYAQSKQGRDYWALRCKEQLRDKNGKLTGEWKWFDMRFAANETLLKGAIHYWTFFATKKRKIALDAMHNGGPAEFTSALAAIWYMTANPDHYRNGLTRLASVADDTVTAELAVITSARFDPEPEPEPEPEEAPADPTENSPPEPPDAPPEPLEDSTPTTPPDDPIEPPNTDLIEDEDRPSGMVPVVRMPQSAWDKLLAWLIELLTTLFNKRG